MLTHIPCLSDWLHTLTFHFHFIAYVIAAVEFSVFLTSQITENVIKINCVCVLAHALCVQMPGVVIRAAVALRDNPKKKGHR